MESAAVKKLREKLFEDMAHIFCQSPLILRKIHYLCSKIMRLLQRRRVSNTLFTANQRIAGVKTRIP